MDEETEAVQSQEDQGDSGSGDSPYADYLTRIPEEARSVAEEAFKAFDANTTRRFQEAAEYRKQWEPLEELGVNQRDPAEIEWAMQVADFATSDPAEFQKWVNNTYASQHGLTPAEQQGLEEEYVDPSVENLVQQRLQSELGPVSQQLAELAEWRAAQDQASREQQAQHAIRAELDELKDKHPDSYNEEFIEMFIPRHMETDPTNAVRLAFDDAQRFVAQVEKNALQGKANAPKGAESGGAPDGTPESINTMEKARAAALQMLRANNRA